MKEPYFISVIIATRNRAYWLADTLQSLSRQTRPADEIIVVDNASEDNSREVVSSFQDKLPIKYLYEGKKGIPYARNCGATAARGDIVAFVDDDTVTDENWLKYIEMPFIRDPNIGVVGGLIKPYDRGNSYIEKFYIENMLIT
jgi:glycosyltransferase involved in cell wall biosynthesis